MTKTQLTYVIVVIMLSPALSGCLGEGNSDVTADDIEDRVFILASYHSIYSTGAFPGAILEDVWVISALTLRQDGLIFTHNPLFSDADSKDDCESDFEDNSWFEGYWFEGICFFSYPEPSLATYSIEDSNYSYSLGCVGEATNADGCAFYGTERTTTLVLSHRDHPISVGFQGEIYTIVSLIQMSYLSTFVPANPTPSHSFEPFGPDNPSSDCNIWIEIQESPKPIYDAAAAGMYNEDGTEILETWNEASQFVSDVAQSVPACENFYLD